MFEFLGWGVINIYIQINVFSFDVVITWLPSVGIFGMRGYYYLHSDYCLHISCYYYPITFCLNFGDGELLFTFKLISSSLVLLNYFIFIFYLFFFFKFVTKLQSGLLHGNLFNSWVVHFLFFVLVYEVWMKRKRVEVHHKL